MLKISDRHIPQAPRTIPDEKQTETFQRQPHRTQATNRSSRISEEGITNQLGNPTQAAKHIPEATRNTLDEKKKTKHSRDNRREEKQPTEVVGLARRG